MRRLLSVVFALCLCLSAASQGLSAEARAGDSDAPGDAAPAMGAADSVPPAPAGGNATAADSPVPASEAAAEAAPVFTGNPIPDAPPPGWTEEQLANLRKLEIQLRHQDTWPDNDGKRYGSPYEFTLFVSDVGALGKKLSPCVRRILIVTEQGDLMMPKQGFSPLTTGQCIGYHNIFLPNDTDISAQEVRIRRATMDVAPHRDSPVTSELRELDAMPLLRSVPLQPVILTMAKRPLPKMPAKVPLPSEQNSWPAKLRVHLADAFTDPEDPDRQCVSFTLNNLPMDTYSFSKFLIRTDAGDYASAATGIGRYMTLCAPGGIERIDIRQATVWKGGEPINAAPLLVDDGFTPLPFVTDQGPLPPTAAGMYPVQPWVYDYGFKPYAWPHRRWPFLPEAFRPKT